MLFSWSGEEKEAFNRHIKRCKQVISRRTLMEQKKINVARPLASCVSSSSSLISTFFLLRPVDPKIRSCALWYHNLAIACEAADRYTGPKFVSSPKRDRVRHNNGIF
jgi:hypothetical protein